MFIPHICIIFLMLCLIHVLFLWFALSDPLAARQCHIRNLRREQQASAAASSPSSPSSSPSPSVTVPPAYPGQFPTVENDLSGADPSALPPYSFCFEYALASALGSLPAALSVNAQTNLHQVSALVGHSRRLYLNYKQVRVCARVCECVHVCLSVLVSAREDDCRITVLLPSEIDSTCDHTWLCIVRRPSPS
jgi:hypothetical protein